jgi:hypothetical protein
MRNYKFDDIVEDCTLTLWLAVVNDPAKYHLQVERSGFQSQGTRI